jgi:hypothetical protein
MQNKKLFGSDETNNLSQKTLISITDSILFPNRSYLMPKIQGVLRYSSDKGIIIKLEDHDGNEITVEDLVDRYYKDPDIYFENSSKSNCYASKNPPLHELILPIKEEHKSEIEAVQEKEVQKSTSSLSQSSVQSSKEEEQENNFVKQGVCDEHLGNIENASELHENTAGNTKSIQS